MEAKYSNCCYGCDITLGINPSEEEIKNAKQLIVKQICDTISMLAERDDFFVTRVSPLQETSLSWRIICPTLEENNSKGFEW